jgi:putative membrane protein
MKLKTPICGLIAALSAFGCGGSDAPAKDPSTVAIDNTSTTTASTMTPPPNAQDSNMQPQAGDTAPAANPKNASDVSASQPTTISDGDIAAITNAANQGEVDQAKLALKKAKSPKVKKFAQLMIDHHSAAISDQTKLVTSAKITPSANMISQQIGTDGASALSTLQSDNSGPDFDKAYIDLQVKEHQDVLTTIDQKLIPNAQNPDLKAALVAFEPKVAEHLKKAQALQAELAK